MANEEKDETMNALEKKTKAEIEESPKKDWLSEEQTIVSKNNFAYKKVFMPIEIFTKSKDKINNRILTLKTALENPDLYAELIDEILSDLIVSAYQDRCNIYAQTLARDTDDGRKFLLKMRQSANNHLINILRAARDIKRPPVQAVVKQAQQVNVAEQMNQGDKQVNITNNQQSS
ncbi:MAG: hypothetical protein ACYS32_17205 [Planctomycetota bacterium]|jgi:hypothetical protein